MIDAPAAMQRSASAPISSGVSGTCGLAALVVAPLSATSIIASPISASARRRGQREAFVILFGDVVAAVAIGLPAADIGHEDMRLARDIVAQVPAVGERIERLLGGLVDLLDPFFLRLRRRFDRAELALA